MATRSRTDERTEERRRFKSFAAPAAALLWPVLLLTASGALMGQEIDWQRDSNPKFTIALLALGIVLGWWAGLANKSIDRDEVQAGRRLP